MRSTAAPKARPFSRLPALLTITASFSLSVQLHYDNLVALAENKPELRPVPSYSTVRRFLKAHGLEKWRRVTSRQTQGAQCAEARLFDREVRSYEADYVNSLWHWDFHFGSKKVLTFSFRSKPTGVALSLMRMSVL